MTPARIAVVAPTLDILGGQGIQARALLDRLAEDGQAATLVPINPRFPRAFGWVRRVPFARTLLNELMYIPGLSRLMNADVVHVFSASYVSFLLAPLPAMIAGRAFGKRVILHYHSGEADDHLSRWGVLVHPWLRLADEIVVPSEYLRDVFARYGYQVRVVHNVVDVSQFRYRDRRPLRPRVLSVRNLENYYRIDTVIQAFARFRSCAPEATLTIAGYGSQELALKQLASSVAGEAIRFVGKVAPPDMPALYDEHDLFLNASELDNQPVSILEACASGMPIASTAVGDIPFMLSHGETALLTSPGDVEGLAEHLTQIWRHPDPARARARRARERVTDFTWPAVRERWAHVYLSTSDEIALAPASH